MGIHPLSFLAGAVTTSIVMMLIIYIISKRRVVEENYTHVVEWHIGRKVYQAKEHYYEWPEWVIAFGVTEITKMPCTIEVNQMAQLDNSRGLDITVTVNLVDPRSTVSCYKTSNGLAEKIKSIIKDLSNNQTIIDNFSYVDIDKETDITATNIVKEMLEHSLILVSAKIESINAKILS